MTSFLFRDAVGQYIDGNGKTRMLQYTFQGTSLSLMTSPIPPLDLPTDTKIYTVGLKRALDFIKEKNFQITYQDGNKTDGIQGIWIETREENPGIYYGYVPIQISKYVKDVPFAEPTKNDPLRTDDVSDLANMRFLRRTATFLKQYVLYSYALNPDEFGEDSFVVIPGHKYDIDSLNKRVFKTGNSVMYSGDKLVVTSEKIRDHLLNYLKVQLLNDKDGVENMKNIKTVVDYYQSIPDFRPFENQLIFMNKNGLLRWRTEIERSSNQNEVSSRLIPSWIEPYFYRNPRIRKNHLMIVQNVKYGTLERALTVALRWIKDKVNLGYDVEPASDYAEISYVIYSDSGEIEKKKLKTPETAAIIRYDGVPHQYAAILFF